MKYIKKPLNAPLSINRKFYYIFTDKQKKAIIDEMTYYKSIYNAVEDEVLFEVVVNKLSDKSTTLILSKFPEINPESDLLIFFVL